MRKMTAILLALCLLLMSGLSLAEEGVAPPMGDLVWMYDEFNEAAYVEGALSGDVTIPAEVDGMTTYRLMFSALCDQNAVTSLTLPDTMIVLQETAIANMEGLQSVTLNDGLEVIDGSNFNRCPSLTSVTIPASVRMISRSFMNCDNLREICFEGECPVFLEPDFCFFWMPDDYVIYVPDDQFDAYAAALENVGDAVDHLRPSGKNAVVRDAQDNESWFEFDEVTGTITGYTQQHAYVEIPTTINGVAVKSIGEGAMSGNSSLVGVVLPEGLETVCNAAFCNASNLLYVKLPSTLKTIADDAFFDIAGSRIDWSEGLETIGARAFQRTRMTTLTLPSTVKSIGESAFERVPLGELYLGGALEGIGSRAFAECFLSYMAFDLYTPIDIAADAFANSNVADLDLPWDSTLENREAYAELLREQCPNCTVWINNPESGGVAENPTNDKAISRFENGVLTMYKGDQPDLTTWTDYDGILVTALGDGVFKGNRTLRSFYPHHCGWFTTIGNEAFADSSVEYVELFGSITTIGSGAFRNCLNITELTLPASLTSIGADALAGCDNLQTLTVLCDPAVLPDGLLDECFAHTEIYAAPDATDEQVRLLSEKAHRPWYVPVSRVGEPANDLIEMPYAMLSTDDFWYDTEYARLDRYHGYELNLYLPREVEDVTLTTLGGDMMGRARGGDNYDMELPVRSVVIPENYTNIDSTAFAGCETLETVVCYVPLEVTAGMFEGCTNLRQVVFVNGVRSLGRGIFYGCDKLETVYVGPYVETIDAEAFVGCPGFDQSRCITDPELMPDVEALLATVRSTPMPEPTPEPTPAPAMPIGEAGAPYFGEWQIETVEIDGESYTAEQLGSEMSFTLNADGTAESEGEVLTWTLENGVVMMDGMSMTANADGKLVMEEDGMKWIFAKVGGASVSALEASASKDVSAALTSGDGAAYIGTWYADTLEMEGEVYPVAEMGLVMYLTLNADGTAEYFDGESTESSAWVFENGTVIADGVAIQLTQDGRLLMEDEDSKLFFVKADGAAAVPDVADVPAALVSGDGGEFVGAWRADTLEMESEIYHVAEMGLEMTFTLNADGTCESFDGEVTETGTWTVENGVLLMEGMPMTATEEGALVMEEEGMKLVFVRDDGAEISAAPSELTSSVEQATLEPTAEAETFSGDTGEFVGTWRADTLEMEGEVYPVAEMGFEMYFKLNADGTAGYYDGESTETSIWVFENGTVFVGEVPIQVTQDGKLLLEGEDSKLFFVRDDGAKIPTAPSEPIMEAEEGFIGTWYGCYMSIGVMNCDPRGLFDLSLTIEADGRANLVYPTDEAWHWTENADGSLLMTKDSDGNEMPLSMLEDGFICLGKMDGDGNALGGYLIFSRDASAVWSPDMVKADVKDPIGEAQASMDVSAELSDRMEVRYVCRSAEANGVALDASLMGGEYALTFHANGTVDFVMVGNTIPGLKWTQGENAFIIDYYGNTLEAVLTENGLDMNYFDSMLMHFEPKL